YDQAMLPVGDRSVDGEEVPSEVQISPLQAARLADPEAGPCQQIDHVGMIGAVLVRRADDPGQLLLRQSCRPAALILRFTPLPLETPYDGVSWDALLLIGCVQHRADSDQDVLEHVPTKGWLVRKKN